MAESPILNSHEWRLSYESDRAAAQGEEEGKGDSEWRWVTFLLDPPWVLPSIRAARKSGNGLLTGVWGVA